MFYCHVCHYSLCAISYGQSGLWINSAITVDRGWSQWSSAPLTMLRRNSWSITGQMHEKLTSICQTDVALLCKLVECSFNKFSLRRLNSYTNIVRIRILVRKASNNNFLICLFWKRSYLGVVSLVLEEGNYVVTCTMKLDDSLSIK